MASLPVKASLLDRLIGYLNPDAGLTRHRARQLLKRAYEGASRMDGWAPRRAGAGPNTDHLADATELRNRARSLVQNVPYISRGIDALVANLVGTGIKPRSLSKKAQKINDLHARWAKECDADGRQDLYGLQKSAIHAMKQDGEVLIRLRPRRRTDGLAVPLQLQLLEIDWLDTSKNGTVNGNLIVNGIEYDMLGRVVNFWIYDQHPGEMRFPGRRRATSNPVPAENIIHLYKPERPGQGRGFTCLASVIARVRDLMTYEDAELHRKNLETRLGVVVSGSSPADHLPLSDSPSAEQVKANGNLGTLLSGSIMEVPVGMNMETIEPKAAGGYVDYIKYNLHLIAAGIGVTYEMMTGDASDVTYSSARINQNEFRRLAEQEQWLVIIPKLCEPIWQAFIKYAELAGAANVETDMAVDWSIPKWSYVNPKEDVAADLNEIFGGLSSFSEKMRVRGYEPDLVFSEMASDMERFKELGLFDFIVMMQTNRTLTEAEAKGSATSAAAGAKK